MTILLLTLSAIVGMSALYPYLRNTIRGRVKPRIITWSIWAFLAGVMTVSAFIAGELPSAVLSIQGLLGCSAVVLFGWRKGSVQIGRLDIASLIGALIGLVILMLLHSPTVALLLSVSIDAVAFAPTLAHAWTDPDEESLASYALNIASAGLALLAVVYTGVSFAGLIYPVYSTVFNSIMVTLLVTSNIAKNNWATQENDYMGLDV